LCCLTTFSSLPLVTHTTGMTHLKVTRQECTWVAQWDVGNELYYNSSRIQFKHAAGRGEDRSTSRILGHGNGADQLLKITRFGRQ